MNLEGKNFSFRPAEFRLFEASGGRLEGYQWYQLHLSLHHLNPGIFCDYFKPGSGDYVVRNITTVLANAVKPHRVIIDSHYMSTLMIEGAFNESTLQTAKDHREDIFQVGTEIPLIRFQASKYDPGMPVKTSDYEIVVYNRAQLLGGFIGFYDANNPEIINAYKDFRKPNDKGFRLVSKSEILQQLRKENTLEALFNSL